MSVSDDPLIQLLLNHDRVDDWGAMYEDELDEYIDLADAIRELIASEVSDMGAPEEGEFRCTCAECSRCLYWDLYERIAARIRGKS
jgi:hypothetical protein